jgi:NAD dependent epimerase/dehydratase family enzyme
MAEETILSGQRVMPRALLRAGFEFRFPDLESALREILK